MRNVASTAYRLHAIKALGVRIAVDDFGNESEPTGFFLGTPAPDLSPLDLYDGSGALTYGTGTGQFVATDVTARKAAEAVELGIATRLCEPAELVAVAMERARQLAAKPLGSLRGSSRRPPVPLSCAAS